MNFQPDIPGQHDPTEVASAHTEPSDGMHTRPAHPRFQLSSLDEWARKGMKLSQVTLDQVHHDFGFPPFGLGSWRRKFVRVCRDATLLVC